MKRLLFLSLSLVVLAGIAAASQTIIRPSAFSKTTTGNGTFCTYCGTKVWDNNVSTAAEIDADPLNPPCCQSSSITADFFGFPSILPNPLTVTLTIIVDAGNFSDPGAQGSGYIAYSLNGGTSYSTLASFSTNTGIGGKRTFNVSLPRSQNTTLVRVRAFAFGKNGSMENVSQSSILLYEVWITATY